MHPAARWGAICALYRDKVTPDEARRLATSCGVTTLVLGYAGTSKERSVSKDQDSDETWHADKAVDVRAALARAIADFQAGKIDALALNAVRLAFKEQNDSVREQRLTAMARGDIPQNLIDYISG